MGTAWGRWGRAFVGLTHVAMFEGGSRPAASSSTAAQDLLPEVGSKAYCLQARQQLLSTYVVCFAAAGLAWQDEEERDSDLKNIRVSLVLAETNVPVLPSLLQSSNPSSWCRSVTLAKSR